MTEDKRRALVPLTKQARANRSLAFRVRLVLAWATTPTQTAVGAPID
jgi:hypothetical protein